MTKQSLSLTISFTNPPIPSRAFDYCVFISGTEEDKRANRGWGPTPRAAFIDFLEESSLPLSRIDTIHLTHFPKDCAP